MLKNLTVFEKSKKGRNKFKIGNPGVKEEDLSKIISPELIRKSEIGLPSLSENEVVRHFTNLAKKNYGVDNGMYPLGSCTMKYNPKINEEMAGLSSFTNLHPLQKEEDVQGALEIMYELGEMLKTITGLTGITLQPSAGAHGELCGLLIARKFFRARGEKRNKVIIPDSAHGTNFASASMTGFEVIEIKSAGDGTIDLGLLRRLIEKERDSIALIMITNPNTLGIFEKDIIKISEIIHLNGGLLYYDGANLNAISGILRPGDMGFDIVHLNLHKTFSTPHGGGGPGSGPILVCKKLADYLPVPTITKKEQQYHLNYNVKNSIGKIKSYYGNFAVCLKAYCYLLTTGSDLREISTDAVLNANYLKVKISKLFDIPYFENTMHEFVLSVKKYKNKGISALNVAKRLIDYGYHPPTIYFPVIVEEAMMIEPTETESLDNLNDFYEALSKIVDEIESKPEVVINAPLSTSIRRVNELYAVQNPVFKV